MHPYVYKKQHKPLRSVLPVFFLMMILCPVSPVNSCNYAVKEVQIYSEIAKGNIRIENNNRVVARICTENCTSDYLYTVTIDKHMLLYHIKSSKFICWNKSFSKLIAKRNPTNLTHCKFEEQPSKTRSGTHVIYTTRYNNREEEIRFTRSGVFSTRRHLKKCLRNPRRKESTNRQCESPNFLPKLHQCVSRLAEFCARMWNLKDIGHNITPELAVLCRNEWSRNKH